MASPAPAGVQSRTRADAGDAGGRDAGAAGRFRTAGDPLLGLAGQRSRRSRRHPGGEGGQAGHQATIVSTDKGYCQLLSPTIRIRDYFQKRWLDAPFIASEFGVTPEQLADYWGLAGISSSKVPGVAGIGPKSAAQLLNEFQDLEGLYARLAEVPEKWRKKLAAHQEMAFTCREVARLQTDLQLDGNLQQLRLTR